MMVIVYESDEFTEYLDYETIKMSEDFNIFQVEEIVDFKTPKKLSSDKNYYSMRVTAQYDLQKKLRKSTSKLACSDSMGGGTVLLQDDTKSDWEEIISNSNSDKKFELLVRNKKIQNK
ncbi:MAG: hypothetical protein CBC01_00600 [Betaproteobacteria bacterium TMED41]|nr:MAG: hypothetical protein CBC01_00600 [Betaproteobacteria bacterium TMED41]|tara:strand:- start:235 stop:588 length:354 start_codon:yes stop_codon:yes gene_type:complete